MKKMLIFGGIIIALFVAIFAVTQMEEKNASTSQKISPVVVPMAKDLNVDMKVMDIEKLDAPWDEYKIQGTPTIIHFKDGKEVSRISGEQPEDKLKEWLEQMKK